MSWSSVGRGGAGGLVLPISWVIGVLGLVGCGPARGGGLDEGLEVGFVAHEKTCLVTCDTMQMGNVLTVELRSPVDITAEIEWTGTQWEGFPDQQLWSNPVELVDVPADEVVSVVLADRVMQCAGGDVDEERSAVFLLTVNAADFTVDGLSHVRQQAPACAADVSARRFSTQ